jgi:hypothetical protein
MQQEQVMLRPLHLAYIGMENKLKRFMGKTNNYMISMLI